METQTNIKKEKTIPKIKIRDSVFTNLFKTPEYTLQLYKALHPEDTDVTEDDIIIVTVENILLNQPYNDLGFTVKNKTLILLEAQTTMTENIVIRILVYIAQTIQDHILKTEQNIYGTKKVTIPEPEFYVLYTGEDNYRPEKLSLAESFFESKNSSIDVKVNMIYDGKEGDIVNQYVNFCKIYGEQCKILGRTKDALIKTINICKDRNILKKYLESREREVVDIMTMLFDQDYATKVMLNESRQEGRREGRLEGRQEGRLEGKLEGILSVAKEMLLNGISTDLIAKVTNISDEELNKMKTELALT